MPKIIDYPRASLRASLDLAEAVYSIGGDGSVDMVADRMNRKRGGAFAALIGAAGKYGLVSSKSQRVTITPLFRDLKLAYSPDEERQKLGQAFLSVPLFADIHRRFAGKQLPLDVLDKLLMREFGVPSDMARRVGTFFLEAAQMAGLFDGSGLLAQVGGALQDPSTDAEDDIATPPSDAMAASIPASGTAVAPVSPAQSAVLPVDGAYVVQVSGPGMNSRMEVTSADDLEIVQAILKRVEKSLKGGN